MGAWDSYSTSTTESFYYKSKSTIFTHGYNTSLALSHDWSKPEGNDINLKAYNGRILMYIPTYTMTKHVNPSTKSKVPLNTPMSNKYYIGNTYEQYAGHLDKAKALGHRVTEGLYEMGRLFFKAQLDKSA